MASCPVLAALSSDAPPTYEQLFGVGKMRNQVREARDTSSNKGIFAVKFCEILCGSVACMICLIVLAALPVAMIVIGESPFLWVVSLLCDSGVGAVLTVE